MLKKIFAPILRFFTLIASALTGITAVCTAVGFLAHRGHLKMLGVSNIPVDLNQYLYTGAQFLAYLPFKLIYFIVLNILDLGRTFFLEFSIILFVIFLVYQLQRFNVVQQFTRELLSDIKDFVEDHRATFWVLILIAQFVAIHQLLKVSEISGLLFGERVPTPAITTTNFPLSASPDLLAFWISNDKIDELLQFVGWLSLIIIASAIILWKMIGTYRKIELGPQRFWQKIWLSANLMLFCTQLILFPINYGVLLLPNEYPEIEVVVNNTVSQNTSWPTEEHLILLDNQNGRFYLYSGEERRLWYIKDSDIYSISYFGMVDIFTSVNLADSTKN